MFPHIRPAGIIFSIVFYSKVTLHKCAGIIRTQVLFEGGPYMRKYGIQYKIDLALQKVVKQRSFCDFSIFHHKFVSNGQNNTVTVL